MGETTDESTYPEVAKVAKEGTDGIERPAGKPEDTPEGFKGALKGSDGELQDPSGKMHGESGQEEDTL